MVRRVIIKTILICFGIFLLIGTIISAYVLKKYPLDTEEYTAVVIAAVDIEKGSVIDRHDITTKVIQLSSKNSAMATDINMVVGKKAVSDIQRNDYVKTKELLSREDWFDDDERIIVLQVSIEDRLANLIKRGSYVDILLKNEKMGTIESVLCKVRAEEILGESGTPLDSKTGMNSSTAYMKLVLNKSEREKLYNAKGMGKFIYELYCDDIQKARVN